MKSGLVTDVTAVVDTHYQTMFESMLGVYVSIHNS